MIKEKNIYKYTEDLYIKNISISNPFLSLKLALQRFNLNKWTDLWDYKHLMYIYVEIWEFNKVIDLGKVALYLINKYEVKNIWIHAILSKMVQAYLFSWKINEANNILSKYNDIDMFFEKFVLEYLKWNYAYLISKYSNINNDKRHYIWIELFLLAKTYVKLYNFNQAIYIFKEMYSFSLKMENEHKFLATFYWYISLYNLMKLDKENIYNEKFDFYREKIDKEELFESFDNNIKLNYNKDFIYYTINRFESL